ncbi:O-methyl transferase B [Annulohypoxylon truncatum]|uniref:O-methyl transferase B n=1 Tax=Annulohypoxylon truncatum TaxID=327061 RepID=UPI0020082533|nr:O-methyl transferase B [Annulohypoxylon truncatum]KAI1206245.1 O-methyl transferase B [Annulohypoxylon truncatum]
MSAVATFDKEALAQAAATSDRATRRNLIVALRRMADSLEDSIGTMHRYAHIEQEKAMIQVGLDLGIFKVLAKANGAMTVDDVAKETGADPLLMKRILRFYNAINVAREVGPHQYEATNITHNLTEEFCTVGLSHFWGFVAKQYPFIPEFLKENGYQNTTDPKHTVFQKTWNTPKTPFELMPTLPEAMDDFHTYMALRRQTELSWLTVYPARSEAAGLTDPQRPLYVNIGGGIGHQCAQFREKYPDMPGRVILQDLPDVVARALPTPGVENMAYDFFEPQPVRGAKFYFMRGVPHNHPSHRVKVIFERVREAMAPDSVLLVDEAMLPATDVGYVAASIDLTMMGGFASMERTEDDWRDLAESAGLELVRTFTYNALEHETVMEMRLPRGNNAVSRH